jgi:tripartite-type tricarboxylate transporter receptor subunit TctC
MPLLPDVPTLKEAGLADFENSSWIGVFGPPGLPPALGRRLNEELNLALKLPEVRDAFAAQGAEVFTGSPAQLAALLKNDIALMGKLVRQAKVQPE